MDGKLLVAGLTGGLAGAILTQVLGLCHRFWKRPIVDIIFDEGTNGCNVGIGGDAYLRLKILNKGRGHAKSVHVMYANSADGSETEIYGLHWAGNSSQKLDIPSKTFLFCDIYALKAGKLDLFTNSTSRYLNIDLERSMEARIYICGDNFNTKNKKVSIFASAHKDRLRVLR